MLKKRILIVEDESTLRTALFRVMGRQGHQVVTASTSAEAHQLGLNGGQIFDLVLLDVHLPDASGLELLKAFRAQSPETQILILTGQGTVEMAVEATKMGAFHFMTKPFHLDELMSLVERALVHVELKSENKELKAKLRGKYQFQNIVGQSEEIQNVLDLVQKVADSDATVLLFGESGTGKELIAKALHYNSSRKDLPFVPLNCGAIPAELLESELFGHVKGAFTGAVQSRIGRFEAASGGTLFLDEIGDMSPNLQVKLLRVLQEKKFEPVGSNQTLEADVRVITATHIDLERAVEEGRFREDLYYRLNVIPISIPPLRSRSGDVPLLLEHFMNIQKERSRSALAGVSDEVVEVLKRYRWPGNIRELENLVERVCVLKKTGQIELADLPAKYKNSQDQSGQLGTNSLQGVELPPDGLDFNSAVDAYENHLILQALEKTGWNRNQAASILRLNRTTLVEKIKKKGLSPAPGKGSLPELNH